jgi:hypothetical protein
MPKLPKNKSVVDIIEMYFCLKYLLKRCSISNKLKNPKSKPVHANESINIKSNQIGTDVF